MELTNNEKRKLSVLQKLLLLILYGLFLLMIIFSIWAIKNTGQEGYNDCVQEKCEERGQEYCQKFREINNCCLGAGGQIAPSENGYACVFA